MQYELVPPSSDVETNSNPAFLEEGRVSIQLSSVSFMTNEQARYFIETYETHNYISDLWYHERSLEEKIRLAQLAVNLNSSKSLIENFEYLISKRHLE